MKKVHQSLEIIVLMGLLVVATSGCDKLFGNDDDDGSGNDLGGVGDTCGADIDCREMLICEGAMCIPSPGVGQDGYCELSANCAEGLYCSYGRTCQPAGASGDGGPCGTTEDCESGYICTVQGLGGRCRIPGEGDIGDPCESAFECFAGLDCVVDVSDESTCDSPPRSSDPEPPPSLPYWTGEECVEDDSTASVAYFRVPRGGDLDSDFYRLPFPNDIRRTESGLDLSGHPHPETAVSDNIIDLYLRAAESDLDGFSRNPSVFFRFSTPQNYDTVHDAIIFVNITPDSPEYGETHGFGWYATHYSGSRYICDNWVAIRPTTGFPLNSGETYAIMIDNSLTPDEGGAYQRAPDFDAMISPATPSSEALTDAWQKYAPLRDFLDASETWSADDILVAAVFTTQRTEEVTSRFREVIRDREPPAQSDLTVCDEGVTSPCDDGTEQRACGAADDDFYEIHGRLTLTSFQQGTPPYATPDDGGEILTDTAGRPRVTGTQDVCFAMTIPRDVPMPEGGFPLLIYGHGTGGSYRNAILFGLAEDMASTIIDAEPLPIATVSIDFPQHGSRRGDSQDDPEILFFNYMNPRAARDNVLQGAADLHSVVYWAENLELTGAQSPTGEPISFNPDRIALYGHSQGATHAGIMVPFEPTLIAVALSGEGGLLTASLLNKTEPYDIAGMLPYALLDPNQAGNLAGASTHPALALFQMFFDRSDPVNFGGLLRPESQGENTPLRHVYMAYGLGDNYSPEPTQIAYARSARFVVAEPVLTVDDQGEPDDLGLRAAPSPVSGNVRAYDTVFTHAMRQYEPDGDYDGHHVATRHPQGRADLLRFLRMALNGETPKVGPGE